MIEKQNQELKILARNLRKNMTRQEKHLWYDFLKKLPVTVKSQKIIGNYIVDFYISQAHIVIELDGNQHGEKKQEQADVVRDATLRKMGLTVLRYPNAYIDEKFDSVCRDIVKHLRENGISVDL